MLSFADTFEIKLGILTRKTGVFMLMTLMLNFYMIYVKLISIYIANDIL